MYLKHCWTASNRHMSSPKRTTPFQHKDIICHSSNISPASRNILFATRHISLRYHIGYLQPAKITGHMCPVGQCSSTRTNRDITFPKRNTSFPNETTSSPERNISWPNIQIIFAKRIIWFRRDFLRVVSSTNDTTTLCVQYHFHTVCFFFCDVGRWSDTDVPTMYIQPTADPMGLTNTIAWAADRRTSHRRG